MLLVIDHHDSFTWNLVHALGRWADRVQVVQSEEASIESIRAQRPTALILSPGPGRPEEALHTLRLLSALPRELPLLGVCLGHQIVCHALGARVVHASEVHHGRVSAIHHDAQGLFAGLSSPLQAARYHSLVVEVESLPPELLPTAFAETGELMAVHHRERPWCSVQFHPESFLTEGGLHLLRNFVQAARSGVLLAPQTASLCAS